MSDYTSFISEIDNAIRELKNLKNIAETDVKTRKSARYNAIYGSKAYIQRSKLNIRDCYRRMDIIVSNIYSGYEGMINEEVEK